MSDVSLRPVTVESLDDVLALAVRPDQSHLVATNAKSIAQAHFDERAWFRAIYVDETAVGFLMVHHDVEDGVDFLWRMMIDEQHQGRGYGRQAMELLIEETREQRPHVRALMLSHLPLEGNAGLFYEGIGFTHTGNAIRDELVMRMEL